MLKSLNELIGCPVQATDGEIGRVATAYFDDEHWTVRYLVIDTGGWLPGRKVLVSPYSTGERPVTDRGLVVSLTRNQVENSPSIDTARPVSRQQEAAYHAYYGYPPYWVGSGVWGVAQYPVPGAAGSPPQAADDQDSRTDDRHLRDATAVRGNHIHASDGEIGHIDDFLLDDRSWTIRHLVIDTSNWIGGRHVLVAPTWVGAINWAEATVQVDLPRAAVESSPAFERLDAVDPRFEERLHRHYAKFRGRAGRQRSQVTSRVGTQLRAGFGSREGVDGQAGR